MNKKIYKYLLYLVTTIFFFVTIVKIDIKVFQHLLNLNIFTIFTLLMLQILTIMVISHQWYILIKVFNSNINFLKVVELNLIGTFTESITPGVKSGGEGVKLILLKKNFNLQYNEGIAVIILQKTLSFLIFLSLFVFSIFNTKLKIPLNINQTFLLITLGLGIIIGIYRFIPENLKRVISSFIKKVYQNLLLFKDKKNLLIYLIVNNLIVWLGFPLKLLIISKALNIQLNFLEVSTIIFITYGVSMLPTTPGSIGTYEGIMTLLLKLSSVSTEKALVTAVITRFFTFYLVVLGSGLYLFIKNFYYKFFKNSSNN
ncbi:lysylphosphatidylglycerol synthase transmembrane domain-containing protein [Anaerobranca gottschalkii]|uniref:Phosphatidylglycerol lysyltransferase n=1 Tax=Anaerobranca gottschalkii DSM 13577 TaxID=1120990 RepID=A0A1H9YUV2_9FIRM|nr:lysylphosphatidylglycerol synthase transmembrane domain-containing protein [Anaerobranca gottschalkii]SES72441.1 hypothetical protein SAMN03080614_10056 [Anaerobranca gottschalkii DSM 13577]